MTEIIVLGAGMVGVSTALALQAHGHQVTLVDRRRPGEETSYGNAGMIQAEAAEPYALPLDIPTLFQIATGRTNDVAWSLRGARYWVGPALRYAYHSLPWNYRDKTVGPWSTMIASATTDHAALIEAAGAQDLVSQQGFRKAYRTPRVFSAAVASAEQFQNRYGIASTIMDNAELRRAEPGLQRDMAGAVHWTTAWACTDPGGLVKRYASLFERKGGRFVIGDAMSLLRVDKGWRVDTSEGPCAAESVVICLGPWSPALTARFGHKVPMVYKRGYHRHFAANNGPTIPLMDVETGTFLSPMRQGLRVLTGAELNALDADPTLRQMDRSTIAANELFTLGKPIEEHPWMGTRPCLPQMLPLTGCSDLHQGLWFNFGHGHQGFTLGPTSGRLLAEMMAGRSSGGPSAGN
ncbi:FAD-dependent oxidoreductase [Devosia sp. SD17-2]|uniref:NAD(P)/FAD-dependent oxidoreductase n=1 Tax=Devosia sp. SD17-2 TaxID=2976459 RepID=UPI0023D7E65D|nr:FAD-dependent oxidoreductase [Devosia sp. SD17-2]WEJ35006.1 FAD-binding oxidoreductase [Devosia sp. SD17-2]